MFPTRRFSGFLRNEGVFAGRGHQHFFPGGRGGEGVPTPVLRDGSGRGGRGTAAATAAEGRASRILGAGRVPGFGTQRREGRGGREVDRLPLGRGAPRGGSGGGRLAPVPLLLSIALLVF